MGLMDMVQCPRQDMGQCRRLDILPCQVLAILRFLCLAMDLCLRQVIHRYLCLVTDPFLYLDTRPYQCLMLPFPSPVTRLCLLLVMLLLVQDTVQCLPTCRLLHTV
nr:unnamed protein product [Callosobruchus analis]